MTHPILRFFVVISIAVAAIAAEAQESAPASRPAPAVHDEALHLDLFSLVGFAAPRPVATPASAPAVARPAADYEYLRPDGVRVTIDIVPWKLLPRPATHVFHALEMAADRAIAGLSGKLGARQRTWAGNAPVIRCAMQVGEKNASLLTPLFIQVVGFAEDALLTTVAAPAGAAIDEKTIESAFAAAERPGITVPSSYRAIIGGFEISHPAGWTIKDAVPLLELTAPDRSVGVALGFEDRADRKPFSVEENNRSLRALAAETRGEKTAAAIEPATRVDQGAYRFSESVFSAADDTLRTVRYYPAPSGRLIASGFTRGGERSKEAELLDRMLATITPLTAPESKPAR